MSWTTKLPITHHL